MATDRSSGFTERSRHRRSRRPPRLEAGYLLRQLQMGKPLGMPQSRPMPVIGIRCHEPRIQDAGITWRLIYRTDPDAVVILEAFGKKNRTTKSCRRAVQKETEGLRQSVRAREGASRPGGGRSGAPKPSSD